MGRSVSVAATEVKRRQRPAYARGLFVGVTLDGRSPSEGPALNSWAMPELRISEMGPQTAEAVEGDA